MTARPAVGDKDLETAEILVDDGVAVLAVFSPIVQSVFGETAILACVVLCYFWCISVSAQVSLVVNVGRDEREEFLCVLLGWSAEDLVFLLPLRAGSRMDTFYIVLEKTSVTRTRL